METAKHICGEEHAKWLDNPLRNLIHNPKKMFKEFVHPGGTVLDIGCGPGTFTLGLAKLVGPQGNVIAVDIQEGMLKRTQQKIERASLQDRVSYHKCDDSLSEIATPADFIVTFYMVHETPNPKQFARDICSLLKPGGYYYLAEPKFHVSKSQYDELLEVCKKEGLAVVKEEGIISRIAVFRK